MKKKELKLPLTLNHPWKRLIGVGTMGAPGAGAPLCFLIVANIARLIFILSDHTALAYL